MDEILYETKFSLCKRSNYISNYNNTNMCEVSKVICSAWLQQLLRMQVWSVWPVKYVENSLEFQKIVEAQNACIDVLPSISRLPKSRLTKPSTARTFQRRSLPPVNRRTEEVSCSLNADIEVCIMKYLFCCDKYFICVLSGSLYEAL